MMQYVSVACLSPEIEAKMSKIIFHDFSNFVKKILQNVASEFASIFHPKTCLQQLWWLPPILPRDVQAGKLPQDEL